MPFLRILFLSALMLSACVPAGAPGPQPTRSLITHLPSPANTAITTPTLAIAPSVITSPATLQPSLTPVPKPQRASYALQATFNYSRHYLQVNETIDYPNRTGQDLTEIMLDVEANNHASAFRLNSLAADGSPIATYALENNKLSFTLLSPLSAGVSLRLALSYELFLPVIPAPSATTRSVIFGYSARQENLVDWYPYIPPYRPDTGWLIHNPWYYGENTVYEMADFQVDLTIENPPANLTIAAASQAKIDGNHYTYTHLDARNFTFSASDMYVVYARVVGNTTITSYAFPFDATGGQTAVNDSAQAMEVYNRLFGAYPHDTLAVVEADFHDGMEYDGLYFLSKAFYATYDGTPKGYLTMIGVHETAHQWWYARVAEDQALEPWLDEALATYSEYIYYSTIYPDWEDWWWSYRVDYYEPTGWVNLRIYDYGSTDLYRNGVYLRGAHFLNDVRQRMGDTDFFAFLKDYATRYQDQVVTSQDFFDLLKQHTQANLNDLIAAYFKP